MSKFNKTKLKLIKKTPKQTTKHTIEINKQLFTRNLYFSFLPTPSPLPLSSPPA